MSYDNKNTAKEKTIEVNEYMYCPICRVKQAIRKGIRVQFARSGIGIKAKCPVCDTLLFKSKPDA